MSPRRVSGRWVLLALCAALATASCSPTTGAATSTTTDEATTEDPRCGEPFSSEQVALATGQLSDVHGMVASRRYSDVVWVIGEVRAELRLWAVGSDDGKLLGSVVLPPEVGGVIDLAIGPGPGSDGDSLYLALDNPDLDASVLEVMRIDEPDPSTPAIDSEPSVLEFSSSGQRPQAAALMVDGESGDLYVVSTARRKSVLYQATAPLSVGETVELDTVAGINTEVTGADLSPNGDVIAMSTPFDVAIWNRQPGQTVAAAVSSAPCIGLVAESDLRGAIGFQGEGGGLSIIRPSLQPSMSIYSIPAVSGTSGLDATRAGSLTPVVTITDPQPRFLVTDGFPLEIRATVEDDAPVQPLDVHWRLEARQCTGDDCEVTEVAIESGNPITVKPTGAAVLGSEYTITVTYTDNFELTATETLVLPFQLPAPVLGSSVGFNGGSVDVGDIPGLANDLTVEMWIRPEDQSLRRVVLGKAYSGEGLIIQEEDGRLNFFHGEAGDNCCDGSYLRFGSVDVVPLNEWTHVVVTRDVTSTGGLLRFYLDGVLTNSLSIYKAPSSSSLPWLIGNGYRDGFAGDIDEVAIYDRVLTSAEVADHYDAIDDPATYGQQILTDAPVGYWRLDEPAGARARDETGRWDGIYSGGLVPGRLGAARP